MATGGGHPGAGSVTQVTAGRTELDVSLQQPSATQQMLDTFWPTHTEKINNIDINQDFKTQELPLARIKKIMRLDEDVKMISAEAPVLFAKAAEIFIAELSLRAWIHTEDNKRRTLQKNDVSQAVAKYDQFDFLIDIVPRDEIKPAKREESGQRTGMMPDQVQYYLQLAQQTQQALQNQPNTQIQANGIQQVITTTQPAAQQSQQANVITLPPKEIKTQVTTLKETIEGAPSGTTFNTANTTQTQQPQIIHIQTPAATPQPTATDQQQASDISQATTQVFQQHVDASTGQIINTPLQIEENETGAVKILLPQSKKIHLTQEQLQAIQLQMQGKQPGQAITIQTQPGSQESEQEASQQPQPLFQVPIGGESQQVFITQDSEDSDQPQVIIQKQER